MKSNAALKTKTFFLEVNSSTQTRVVSPRLLECTFLYKHNSELSIHILCNRLYYCLASN